MRENVGGQQQHIVIKGRGKLSPSVQILRLANPLVHDFQGPVQLGCFQKEGVFNHGSLRPVFLSLAFTMI